MPFTAISKNALKKIDADVRSWRLHRWVSSDGREVAKLINPKIVGCMADYGVFYLSALYPALRRINTSAALDHDQVQQAQHLEESHLSAG
ncbi:hypothetical protein [Nocardia gamkensis]|uniref:hypothetical protein n=1 Tax=Nocardia gamkensis TaxID=352869 RepID=UPI0037C7F1B8